MGRAPAGMTGITSFIIEIIFASWVVVSLRDSSTELERTLPHSSTIMSESGRGGRYAQRSEIARVSLSAA